MTGQLRSGLMGASVALAIAFAGVVAPDASGNVVTDWNARAQHAIVDVAQELPWTQTRSFAMVSGAVYDAVNAIDGTPYEPYLVAPAARVSYSKAAAVATAAHDVLVGLYPAQRARLDQDYSTALAVVSDGPDKVGGIAVGREAAAAMLVAREDDGVDGDDMWIIGALPGQWRPTPPFGIGIGAQVAFMRPFLIDDADDFRSPPPNPLTSTRYARDLNEVRSVGSTTSTTRTNDQTDAALFWNDLKNPWWSIFDQLAVSQVLSVSETARMLALVNLAAADSFIANFKAKRRWSYWRPVTAIAEAGSDGNPQTRPDPSWSPLLATPPVPEHPSGHAQVSATITTLLFAFFGYRDHVPFTGFSRDTGTTRRYARFSDALREIIDARVWGGIHFRTADNQGAAVGAALAAHVWATSLRRTR